ncbi:MAG: efflux RND transporter periplasmic adaptor subunit [Alphaproteobacteria bacterium]|nr:MAG: efflux RND transporter periplasmic adaptor subunit [Alphaproteobacteria bacterium]
MNRSIIIAIIIALAVIGWIGSGQIDRFADGNNTNAEAATQDMSKAELAKDADKKADEKHVTGVRVQTFTAVPHQQNVIVNGKTEANRVVELRAEISGRVAKVHVDEGDRVKKGDPIVSFDVKDNEARLQEAEALIRQREIEHKAAKSLNKKGFSSDTSLASANAQLDSAKAQVKAMKIRIQDLVVKAPFDGYVESRDAEIGDYIKDGNQIATIIESDPLLVTGQISELRVNNIEVGGEGTATLVTGEKVSGKIKFISKMSDPATRTFRVELEVPNKGNKLRSGVTAEIAFKTKSIMAHFLSPAILTLNDAGVLGLRAVDEKKIVRFYPVKILSDTEKGVWVTGLPDKVTLIVVGQDFVRDGDKVETEPNKVAEAKE